MKKIFLMGAIIFGVSFFTSNCALFDPAQNGPSCSIKYLSVNYMCLDLIETDAAAMTAFETDCTAYETGSLGLLTSTFDTIGCDFTVFDVPGHCEVIDSAYSYAIWFSSDTYTSTSPEYDCSISGGTWVN